MNDPMNPPLTLEPVNEGVFAMVSEGGQRLGYLRRIGAV